MAISSKFSNQLTYVVCNILLFFLISSPSVPLVPFCFVVYYCLVCLFLWIKLYGSFSSDSRHWVLLILEIMSLFSILLAHAEPHQCFFPSNFLKFVLIFFLIFFRYIVFSPKCNYPSFLRLKFKNITLPLSYVQLYFRW